jgi:hypothetical protein
MSVTASLNGTLQLTDNLAGNTTFLKQLVLSYAGTVSSFAQGLNLGTGSVAIALPISPAQFVYIRNLAANAGSNLTVTWTPTGGSPATALILSPGAFVIFGETNQSNGISALTLTAAVVNTPVEYLIAS